LFFFSLSTFGLVVQVPLHLSAGSIERKYYFLIAMSPQVSDVKAISIDRLGAMT